MTNLSRPSHDNPATIVFDGAVLGQNWNDRKVYTSISRVAGHHLAGALKVSEWDVVVCSSEWSVDLHGAGRFVEERVEKGIGYRLSRGDRFVRAAEFLRRLMADAPSDDGGCGPPNGDRVRRTAGTRERKQVAGMKDSSIVWKIGRSALTSFARNLSTPRLLLREARLFHSPLLPFPDAVMARPKVVRLLTVHDLVGLTHPDLADSKQPGRDRERMAGVRPHDFVISVSESTRLAVLDRYPLIPPERTLVAPLAAGLAFRPCLDPQALSAVRAKYGIPPDVPYLLCLALYDPRKNFHGIVRAFAKAVRQERIPGLRLVMAGPLRMEAAAEESRRAMNDAKDVSDRIHVTGWVDEEDLAPLYSGAEAFIFPSYAEGFGLPPLEAMACGTPVIASNATSIPEVVGDAGILVGPDDGDALAQAILNVHGSSALRDEMSLKGLARASLFSWPAFEAKTVEAYRRALDV